MFFDTQKEGSNQERGSKIWSPRRNFEHPDLPRGPFRPKRRSKRDPFRVERRKVPRVGQPPCMMFGKCERPTKCDLNVVHSGGERHDPRLQKNVHVLYGCSDYIFHVGSSYDYRSIWDGGLIAGEDSESNEKDDKHASLQQLIRWWQPCHSSI